MKETISIEENNFEKARKIINQNKDKQIIFTSDDDELNRKILEKLEINVLLLKQSKRKDFQKQRNSGLNQVLAKIAKKKNITIGIDLDEIIESTPQAYTKEAREPANAGPEKSSSKISTKGKNKSDILARIKQNIKLCNKNKLKMKFISEKYKRGIYDLKSIGLILSMPTWMTKTL